MNEKARAAARRRRIPCMPRCRGECVPEVAVPLQVHRSRSSRSTSAPGGRGLRVRSAPLAICSLILIDQLVSACDCAIRDVVRSAGDGWRCRTGASGCGGALLTKAECSGPPRHPLCDRPSLTLVRHCRGEAWSEKKKICTPASITIWQLSLGSLLAVAGSGLVLLRALLS